MAGRTLDLRYCDPFSMTDDQIRERVNEVHIPGNENYDEESLLNVLAKIIKHSNQIVGTDPPPKDITDIADKPLPDDLSLPCSRLNKIAYQMTCHPAHDLHDAHEETMTILHELRTCNWGAKVTITLSAFAVEYGNLLHLAEIQAITDAPLGKLLALLQTNRLHDIETKRKAFAELNKVVNMVFQATQYIMKLENICSNTVDRATVPEDWIEEATKDIPIYVYWIIITTVICFTHMSYFKGDSEDKVELSQFEQKLSSILTNLKVTVDLIETEIFRTVVTVISSSCCII